MNGGVCAVALSGAGYWGSRLARNLYADPDCRLVAVHDRDRARAEHLAATCGAGVADSYDEILDDPGVDALALATPSATHADLVRRALLAGKDVLVEKPLAATVAEAEDLGAIAAARGAVLACDQTYRFSPVVAWLHDHYARCGAAPVHTIDSRRTNVDHGQPDLTVIQDLAYHDLVILDAVLPSRLRVVAVRASEADRIGIGRAHAARLTLELADGAHATIEVDWHGDEKVRAMSFSGHDATVWWDDLAPEPQRLTVQRDARPATRPVVSGPEPLAAVVADFARAVRARRPPAAGASEEVRVLRVLAAATTSAATGGKRVTIEQPDFAEQTT